MDKSTILPDLSSRSALPQSTSRTRLRKAPTSSRLAQSQHPVSTSAARHEQSRLRKRRPSVTYPDSLKPGPDREMDYASASGPHARMNQSMFSLIAAAGSQTDFQTRFGDESSGSDTEREGDGERPGTHTAEGAGAAAKDKDKISRKPPNQQRIKNNKVAVGQSTFPGLEHLDIDTLGKDSASNETGAESDLQRALPRLRLQNRREKNYMSQSMILPGKASKDPSHISPRDSPVMRRIVEDQAQADNDSAKTPSRSSRTSQDILPIPKGSTPDSSPKLALRLKDIFGFSEPEEVISEYPCWLLQSILLQGYLYITAKHFCFYAYLPKKTNAAIKSGSMMKRLKRAPKYVRQWFVLKGDHLTYYNDPASLYFQAGHIDLRYGISASVVEPKEKTVDARDFTVVTQNRTYYFRADSSTSAKEWVKALQRVIFRTHNDGDSVKIALPVENVIDLEDSPVIEFAKTVKIRVIDNDETFAIDEYFFSFFSFGDDAMSIMQSMVPASTKAFNLADLMSPTEAGPNLPRRQAQNRKGTSASSGAHEQITDNRSPVLNPAVGRSRAGSNPSSGGRSRAGSASSAVRPRDFSAVDSAAQTSPSIRPSEPASESFVESGMASSAANLSEADFQSSGSQVLSRSDIFRRPKVDRFPQSPDVSEDEREENRRFADGGSVKTQRDDAPSRMATPRIPDQNPQTSGVLTNDMEGSTPSLRKLVKAGQYPLQRAAGIASYLHRGSKDMSALLATKSMGYVEKVSGMWAGGKQYYQPEIRAPDDAGDDEEEEGDHVEAGNRFRAHFGLPDSERLLATYFGYLHRVLPLYGKIYIGDTTLCFRSLLPGTRTKIILPMADIETIDKETGFSLGYHGLVVVIQGFEEMFFEFHSREIRDDCAVFLLRRLDSVKYQAESDEDSEAGENEAMAAEVEHRALLEARKHGQNPHDLKLQEVERSIEAEGGPDVIFDDPRASILNFKPSESMRITCLTIGSRGDVQPYIGLCKGLLAEGHKPKIASHREFEPWVRKHGIDFVAVDGDPAELMRICVENGMFTPSFFREATSKFRGWLDDLLSSAWVACQDSDLLIESPSTMAGIHIAEALKIPYFRAFTMPWTRTRAYPHAFAVPEHKMGGAYNKMTYVMFDNVFWTAISGQINRWRKKELKLPSTTLDKLHPNKVPFLYNFSPSVVTPPLDYSDWIRVTGYWFLDEGDDYQPDQALAAFMQRAREDGKKLVYIGFGSIVVSDPVALTTAVVEAVLKADVRCILSKGWSDRLDKGVETKDEIALPPEIFRIKSCPHDWLFKQVDCAVHHGGAGTTGASLRAGLPTIIKPFFGDQFFFGTRVEDLGVGRCIKKINVSDLGRAIWEACHSERMIIKAKALGEQIRSEDGVGTAIQAIYRDMEYARSLIKNRDVSAGLEAMDVADEEESWTFIEDDSDPELAKRVAQWDGIRQRGDAERIGKTTSRTRRRTTSMSKAGKLIPGTHSSRDLSKGDSRAKGAPS